jgi:hypothetical protein
MLVGICEVVGERCDAPTRHYRHQNDEKLVLFIYKFVYIDIDFITCMYLHIYLHNIYIYIYIMYNIYYDMYTQAYIYIYIYTNVCMYIHTYIYNIYT